MSDRDGTSKLYAVYVGWPKSGSTWFHRFCEAHRDLTVAAAKDIHYFSENYSKGYDWYVTNFARNVDHLVEVNHDYVFNQLALERIRADFPEVKVLIFLRYPFDWLVSEYRYISATGASRSSFEEFAGPAGYALEYSNYSVWIESLLSIFNRESVFIGLLEDLESQPDKFVSSLASFLEVSADRVDSGYKINEKVNRQLKPRFYWSKAVRNISRYIFMSLHLQSWYGKIKRSRIRSFLFEPSQAEDQKEIERLPAGIVDQFVQTRISMESLIGRSIESWRLKEGRLIQRVTGVYPKF